jgi:hypothetical protein
MRMDGLFHGAPILAAGALSLATLSLAAAPASAQPATPPSGNGAASQDAAPLDAARAAAPLRVLWTSDDASCDGGDVAARALKLVTPGVTPSQLTAKVEVQHGEDWLVRLETESGQQEGRRTLRADSCEEIQQAIALLLAMTMEAKGELPGSAEVPVPPAQPQPQPQTRAQPQPPAATPPAALAAELEGADEPSPPETPRAGVDLGGFARVGARAGRGLQPGYAWGIAVQLGMRLGDFDIGVEGQHWPETHELLPEQGPNAEIAVRRENIGLRACWNLLRAGNFIAAPCVAPQVTFFAFDTHGLDEAHDRPVPPLFGVGVAADLRYEVLARRLSFLLSAGVDFEQKQPFQIGLTDPEAAAAGDPDATQKVEVYRTAGVGSRLEVGIDARF